MKPKKKLLVFSIVFLLLGIGFTIHTIIFMFNPPDFYTDYPCHTYYEATVKNITQGESGNGYVIILEENDAYLMVTTSTMIDPSKQISLAPGDKINFAIIENEDSKGTFLDEDTPISEAIFLSHKDNVIISTDSYAADYNNNFAKTRILTIIVSIVFYSISIIFYIVWFRKRKNYLQRERLYRPT